MSKPESETAAESDDQIDCLYMDELRWCLKILVAAGHVSPDILTSVIKTVRRAKEMQENAAND